MPPFESIYLTPLPALPEASNAAATTSNDVAIQLYYDTVPQENHEEIIRELQTCLKDKIDQLSAMATKLEQLETSLRRCQYHSLQLSSHLGNARNIAVVPMGPIGPAANVNHDTVHVESTNENFLINENVQM